MRTADDFSDENRRPGDEAERLTWIHTWQTMLSDCEIGQARHPIFIALKATIDRYELPVEWLRDLLHAFTMDVTGHRYATYEDLLTYCRYSANPVGRLILTLSGYRDEALYELSDSICTGLQLANHWQDVAVDLEKDRIYLPEEDLQSVSSLRFPLPFKGEGSGEDRTACQKKEPHLQFCLEGRGIPRSLHFEVDRAWELFRSGQSLPDRVKGRLCLELRFTWLGGTRILEKIKELDYDTLHHRPVVRRTEWGWIALKTLLGIQKTVTEHSYVQTVARKSGSNFYFSFFSLPRDQREAITAVYAFCRPKWMMPSTAARRGKSRSGRRTLARRVIARTYEGQADPAAHAFTGSSH